MRNSRLKPPGLLSPAALFAVSPVGLIKAVIGGYAPAVIDGAILLKDRHDLVCLGHDVVHVNQGIRHGVKAEAVNAAVPDLLRAVIIKEIPECLKLRGYRAGRASSGAKI